MSAPLRIAAFASGRGSNLEAVLENIKAGKLNAKVVVVISNRSKAGVLQVAGQWGIPAFHISQIQFEDKDEFATHLLKVLTEYETQLVVLAGYLKKMPLEIVRAFKNKILNIHPALLPSFGGKGLYGHLVHEAVLEYGCKISGATVHLVDDEYDTGAPIVQRCIPVKEGDTAETLAARVLQVEHQIFSEAIQLFAEGKVEIEGRRVRILSK